MTTSAPTSLASPPPPPLAARSGADPDRPDTASTPLSELRRGDLARVVELSTARGDQLARRLADLGLEPGREVEVRRRAPMGDPTVYRAAGYEICLRSRDASLVLVEVLNGVSPVDG